MEAVQLLLRVTMTNMRRCAWNGVQHTKNTNTTATAKKKKKSEAHFIEARA